MIDKREMWAMFNLLDDPQPSIQDALKERMLLIGEEVVPELRDLVQRNNGRNAGYVEDIVDIIRMNNTLQRLGQSYQIQNPDPDLEENVFTMVKYGYPDAEIESYRKRLDEMGKDVVIHAGTHASPMDRFMKMRSYLFSELSFMGNKNDYYNPDNSFFNRVMDLRRGIPITLSVLMLLVGRRAKISLQGIGMPMHFLLKYDDGTRTFFIDAFNAGLIITQEQARAMLATTGMTFQSHMLDVVSDKEIIERMWRNLFLAYQQIGNEREMQRVGQIISYINPDFKVNISPPDEDLEDEDDDDEL